MICPLCNEPITSTPRITIPATRQTEQEVHLFCAQALSTEIETRLVGRSWSQEWHLDVYFNSTSEKKGHGNGVFYGDDRATAETLLERLLSAGVLRSATLHQRVVDAPATETAPEKAHMELVLYWPAEIKQQVWVHPNATPQLKQWPPR